MYVFSGSWFSCLVLTSSQKALNLFNAALVTPTYYVMFTSATIVTSAVLFQGFKGSGVQIATVIMGFLQICSGVVLLQLSKSAKDVPDAAVFKGDLDQIREVATQEEPEYEPKADSIRGAASILRRISTTRRDAEANEARRFYHDKHEDYLKPPGENEIVEWDGIRRRKTVIGEGPTMSRPITPRSPSIKQQLPPLGMSRLPDPEDEEEHRPSTKQSRHSFLSEIRSSTGSVLHPQWRPLYENDKKYLDSTNAPVTMTEMTGGAVDTGYHGAGHEDMGAAFRPTGRERSDTPRSIHWADEKDEKADDQRPIHAAQRQFSFNTMFNRIRNGSHNSPKPPGSPPRSILRRSHLAGDNVRQSATEEEQLGLVKGDSRTSQQEETFGEKLERWSSSESDLGEVQPMHPVHAGRPHGDSVSSMSTSAFPAYEDHHALYFHANVSNPYYFPPSREATASPEHIEEHDGWQLPSGNRSRTRSNSSHARAPPPSQSSFSTHRHPNPLPPLPDERAFSGTETGVRSVSSASSDMGVISVSSSTEARDDDHHAPSPPSYPTRRQSGWRRHISESSSVNEAHPEHRPGNSEAFV